jgi:hypothetical protein
MNHGFFQQAQPAFQRLLGSYTVDEGSYEMLRDILSFGSMCGTALASPILYELRNIWFL